MRNPLGNEQIVHEGNLIRRSMIKSGFIGANTFGWLPTLLVWADGGATTIGQLAVAFGAASALGAATGLALGYHEGCEQIDREFMQRLTAPRHDR